MSLRCGVKSLCHPAEQHELDGHLEGKGRQVSHEEVKRLWKGDFCAGWPIPANASWCLACRGCTFSRFQTCVVSTELTHTRENHLAGSCVSSLPSADAGSSLHSPSLPPGTAYQPGNYVLHRLWLVGFSSKTSTGPDPSPCHRLTPCCSPWGEEEAGEKTCLFCEDLVARELSEV